MTIKQAALRCHIEYLETQRERIDLQLRAKRQELAEFMSPVSVGDIVDGAKVEAMDRIRQDVTQKIFHVQIVREEDLQALEEEQRRKKAIVEQAEKLRRLKAT